MSVSKRANINSSRELRKNQTDAERILWNTLRNRQICGAKFRRQYSIGKYILDFYSPEYKLGIEADGGQHYIDDNIRQDESRTNQLTKTGVQKSSPLKREREVLRRKKEIGAMAQV